MVRVEAARQLGRIGDPAAVAALVSALNDDSVAVQTAAASSLGDSKNASAPDALWNALREPDREEMFRLAAVRALANFHDPRAIGPLIEFLPSRRAEASQALGEFERSALVPALASALRQPATRDIASSMLKSMGNGVGAVIPLLNTNESRYTRFAAAEVLAESDDPHAASALDEALRDSDPEMTAAAWRYLIRQGRPGDEGRLIRTLRTVGTPEMALGFVSSGNATLKTAGEDWETARNISQVSRTSDMPEVHWPGADPKVERLGLYHFDGSPSSSAGASPVELSGVSFVPGRWGAALSVGKGGTLKYPLAGNLDFREGTIEMWISPLLDGSDPIYSKYNHALVLYQSRSGQQFLVSEGTFGGFYAGSVAQGKLVGAGGGKVAAWKSGTWHHIAFTYSARAGRQRFFIDGVMTAEHKGTGPPPDTDAGATFTVDSDPWKNWTAFSMDELEISRGEKSSYAIRGDALREAPFADR
jgi:hypothetical protein